jgi:hypothetical protein
MNERKKQRSFTLLVQAHINAYQADAVRASATFHRLFAELVKEVDQKVLEDADAGLSF